MYVGRAFNFDYFPVVARGPASKRRTFCGCPRSFTLYDSKQRLMSKKSDQNRSDEKSNSHGFKAILRIAWDKLCSLIAKIVTIRESGSISKPTDEGLFNISSADDPKRVLDVIFVHGLDGNAYTTWQTKDKHSHFWPGWLSDELPLVGIWSLGYAVSSSAWKGSTMPLVDRATNILDRLDSYDIGKRPIIFVCHSLGGLVVKQLLRTSHDLRRGDYLKIAKQTQAIVFLATPHTGSALASFLDHVGTLLRTTVSTKELKAHDPHLRDLNRWYRNNTINEPFQIEPVVYIETQTVGGLVLIVDETSADPGIPGVPAIPIDADHISICKFADKDNQIYRRVKKLIEKYAPQSQLATIPARRTTALMEQPQFHGKSVQSNQIPVSISVESPSLLTGADTIRDQLSQKDQQIASLHRIVERLSAEKSGESFAKVTETSSNAPTTTSLTAKSVLGHDGVAKEPEANAILPDDANTDDCKKEQEPALTSADGTNGGDEALEERASHWIDRLEDYLEVDLPKALEISNSVKTWIEANETLISKPRSTKLFRQLLRVEIVKLTQKLPDADFAKAKYLSDKSKI